MRTALLTGIALCLAALAGLTPVRALAADPPSLDRAAVAPASDRNPSAGPNGSAAKGASARQISRPPGQREQITRPLDLSAPPINHVMTPEQVQALIAEPEDSEPADVMVEDTRYQAPVPRGQIQALTWALVHPLEAWRIFTPVTDQ